MTSSAEWNCGRGRLASHGWPRPRLRRALLADAVAVLEVRAEYLAAIGQRVWEPSEDMPALVVVIDEYAELTETAAAAATEADSIARRGRAVAVTLIAATQRPTQKAMGQGALRSQMDVRVSFRVRERKDVDLILGQGMLVAGWHANTLNAPWQIPDLRSGARHPAPCPRLPAYRPGHRQRCDQLLRVASPARRGVHAHAPSCAQTSPASGPLPAYAGSGPGSPESGRESPGALLWFALCIAPSEGASIAELMSASGMNRTTLYRHLTDHLRARRAVQVSRGRWRAATTEGPDAAR